MNSRTDYCTIDDFQREVSGLDDFFDEIRAIASQLERHIGGVLRSEGIPAEILFVGSTNPSRLTTVIDPLTPDDRYPADFDIGIISGYPLEQARTEAVLKRMFPKGNIRRPNGRTEIHTSYNKFPVGIFLMSEEEAKACLPIVYTRNYGTFSPEQIRAAREMRLFAMRSGLYGGYTRGFKGIAMEQLVRRYGDLEQILRGFHTELSAAEAGQYGDVNIPNPVNGSNLAAKIQLDIWKRAQFYLQVYVHHGLLRRSPYTIQTWQTDHPLQHTFSVSAPIDDPFDCYKRVSAFVQGALRKGWEEVSIERGILVIPHYGVTETLISVDLPADKRSEFQQRFRKRWDQFSLYGLRDSGLGCSV